MPADAARSIEDHTGEVEARVEEEKMKRQLLVEDVRNAAELEGLLSRALEDVRNAMDMLGRAHNAAHENPVFYWPLSVARDETTTLSQSIRDICNIVRAEHHERGLS